MNEELTTIAFVLFIKTWTDDERDIEDLTDEDLRCYTIKWKNEWLPGKDDIHCGDCTNVPMACHRCIMDDLFKTAGRILTIMKGA